MRIVKPAAASLMAALIAAPAFAGGPRIYAVEADRNFCPDGLQPVSLNGVICCGTPNQSQTYQQVMRHPVQTRVHRVNVSERRARTCAEGQKGCY
ncbi:hypothetical protein [Roseovarius sp. SYSU LYC5161]|uniref:hypothetical protein n=1 Tax=Roseovarius halophilus (ex Wu et al. 2025) TaxID=3376060 RepID=UPI00287199B2|nr:hypothetical protein [Roseovarius sp.]